MAVAPVLALAPEIGVAASEAIPLGVAGFSSMSGAFSAAVTDVPLAAQIGGAALTAYGGLKSATKVAKEVKGITNLGKEVYKGGKHVYEGVGGLANSMFGHHHRHKDSGQEALESAHKIASGVDTIIGGVVPPNHPKIEGHKSMYDQIPKELATEFTF